MKFICKHRKFNGEIVSTSIEAYSRQEAFKQARMNNWNIVEMIPVKSVVKHKKVSKPKDYSNYVKHVKVPNAEELELLKIRKNSFWFGVFSSLIPIVGQILVTCLVFLKYDIRGLKCCLYGIFLPGLFFAIVSLGFMVNVTGSMSIVVTLPLVAIAGFLCHWIYRNDVLLGYVIPKFHETL